METNGKDSASTPAVNRGIELVMLNLQAQRNAAFDNLALAQAECVQLREALDGAQGSLAELAGLREEVQRLRELVEQIAMDAVANAGESDVIPPATH